MAFEIVVGRSKKDVEKYGRKGTIFLGKQYVQMGAVRSLANEVYLDVASSHVIFVCGKRGGGKSYTMGVMAEGVANLPEEIKKNLSVIMLDTMGVYWTMKYPNQQGIELLKEWGLEAKALDVKIFTPTGFYEKYKEKYPAEIFDKNGKISSDLIIDRNLVDACDGVCDDLIKIEYSDKNFIFFIEPWGQLTPAEMVSNAAVLFNESLEEFETELK